MCIPTGYYPVYIFSFVVNLKFIRGRVTGMEKGSDKGRGNGEREKGSDKGRGKGMEKGRDKGRGNGELEKDE